MIPLNDNDPYIDSTGKRSTLGEKINAGSQYTLPTASADTKGGVKVGANLSMAGEVLNAKAQVPAYGLLEAGKVLTVSDEGLLMWATGGSGLDFGVYNKLIIGRPMFTPATEANKYNIGLNHNPVTSAVSNQPFDTVPHSIDEVFLPDKFNIIEFFKYVTDELIEDLNMVALASELTAVSSITIETPITNYSIIALQGCYDGTGQNNNYDTTLFYTSPEINVPYLFGVKDRNGSYSATLTFTDATHGSITSNGNLATRRIKVFGIV